MCVVIEAFPDRCVLGASSQVEEVQVHCLISHFHLFHTVVDSHCRDVLGHKLLVAEPAMCCVGQTNIIGSGGQVLQREQN